MFKTGDHVIWLADGDIGTITEVAPGRAEAPYPGEYFIEWYLSPNDSGWHILEPGALELLGGEL